MDEPRRNILDLERWAFIITKGSHRNVPVKYVYRPDIEGSQVELPDVSVINSEQNDTDNAPVSEVYFEKLKLTDKGILTIAGFCSIGAVLINYFMK